MPSRWTGPSAAKWFSATATTPSLSAPKTRDIDPHNAECHDGRISVGSDAGTWELSTLLLANDRAIGEGDTLHITSVETGSTMGSVAFDAARDLLSYAASNQVAFAEGEHGTDRFTYSISDGHGGVSTATVTLDIVGTNDAVVLDADASGPHRLSETAKVTGSLAAQAASGDLRFHDADLSETHVTTAGPACFSWSGGQLTMDQVTLLTAASTFSLQVTDSTGAGRVQFAYGTVDKTLDFLAWDETLTVIDDVQVAGGLGSSSLQAVEIMVTGANDAPTIAQAQSLASETVRERSSTTGNAALDQTSGRIAFSDADLTDRPDATVVGQTTVYKGARGAEYTLDAAQSATIRNGFALTVDTRNTNSGAVNWSFALKDSSVVGKQAGALVVSHFA